MRFEPALTIVCDHSDKMAALHSCKGEIKFPGNVTVWACDWALTARSAWTSTTAPRAPSSATSGA